MRVQIQNDSIDNGLYNIEARQRLSVTRQDRILESSVGVYLENTTHWLDSFRTVAGLRADAYRFDVESNVTANSGTTAAQRASRKLNLIFGPWAGTEYYLNLGEGFHSNDARGTTLSVDPKTGAPAAPAPPLVRSTGAELGGRTTIIPHLRSVLTFYLLDFDSESVATLAVAVDNLGPVCGEVGYRYFGPRPLLEDNSVRSTSTATIHAHAGYKFSECNRLELEAFNLTNRQASAIDYYYTSRLPGEPAAGVSDIHFHPVESRSIRVSYVTKFCSQHRGASQPRVRVLVSSRLVVRANFGQTELRRGYALIPSVTRLVHVK